MSEADNSVSIDRLKRALADLDRALDAPQRLDRLIRAGFDRLPLPGLGATLRRWQALAAVAADDLSLAKLYEGHTDALAIRAELGVSAPLASGSWAVWAAEAPQGRASIDVDGAGAVRLSGAKCWCSGAATAQQALLTAWWADGRGPQLVAIDLRRPGVRVTDAAWHAVGMAGSASLDVAFDSARAELVGEPGAYLNRPGFWQGGAGIAACWYGGALSIAGALREALQKGSPSPTSALRLAALGRVDVELQSTACLLREAAAWIDASPTADASAIALRVRLRAERCATSTLDEVGRALGAAPFCRDARFARAAADLPVFIRQSHAERDLAALGERLLVEGEATSWRL